MERIGSYRIESNVSYRIQSNVSVRIVLYHIVISGLNILVDSEYKIHGT